MFDVFASLAIIAFELNLISPTISSLWVGEFVPIPTFPLSKIITSDPPP